MSAVFETELKLKVIGDGTWDQLRRADVFKSLNLVADWQEEALEAQYFDTADHRLRQVGLAYRVRREQGQWMATVKLDGSSAGGLHQRQEYNVAVPDAAPDLSVFANLAIGELICQTVGEEPLTPVFATAFSRRTLSVNWQESMIEIALDHGMVLAGTESEPILEIELELKDGHTAALISLGAELARALPLAVEPKSKYYRGLLLAGLVEEEPVPDAECSLSGAEPVGQALEKLLSVAVYNVFSSQQAFFDNRQEPETMHQLRVKLRRLRAVLSFAKPILAPEESAAWQQDLGSWGRSLGSLRDLDVLTGYWQAMLASPFVEMGGKPWLGEQLAELRLQEEEKAYVSLINGKLTAVLLGFWAWVLGSPWQLEATESIEAYSLHRLRKWLEDLVEIGKNLGWENQQESHRARIHMKKIRYLLASLPFMESGRTIRLIGRLKGMQDCIGALIDYAVCARQLNIILKPASTRAVYRDIGMLKGWLARGAVLTEANMAARWKKTRRSARRWLKG